jgi:hypothetical protein
MTRERNPKMTTLSIPPAAGWLATALRDDMPDDNVRGIPLAAYPYQVSGQGFTEWMYLQLADDGTDPAILMSCPPEAKQDGDVKLTAAEAIQLAGALLSFAVQADQDLTYAADAPSPCCPGETLLPTRHPVVVCMECGSKYNQAPGGVAL